MNDHILSPLERIQNLPKSKMNIQKAYDQWSATYDVDENSTRNLDEIITKKILSTITCNTILEIGCGTGKNTQLLAQIAETVIATDFSLGMISKAKLQIQAENVSFRVGDLTKKWTVEDQSIDLVVCNLVLEHIENLGFIFSEVSRVLGKGGKFFISELHPFKQYQGKQANFQQKGKNTKVEAFLHNTTDFIDAANKNGLRLLALNEWWSENNHDEPPRLMTFMFEKQIDAPGQKS